MIEQLKEILAEVQPLGDFSAAAPESKLVQDLGIDSLTMVLVAAALSEKYDIEFDMTRTYETVQDILDSLGDCMTA